jgi:lysophospholipid acyltransferase (LPLAT)-like uncharacterized protein
MGVALEEERSEPLGRSATERSARIRRHSLWFRFLLLSTPWILDLYMRFVDWTSTKTVLHGEHDGLKLRGDPTVFSTFHQGLLYSIQHFRDRDGVIMASRSRDGDLVAAVLRRFGFRSVRGSDSRYGRGALKAMIAALREGASGGMVCDGSRGPYGAVKIGVVALAKHSGRPLVPCGCWMTRKLLLRNWDRTLIPLPFTRICFAYGEPIRVAADATREESEAIRRELAERITALIFEAQEALGEPRRDFRPAPASQTPETSA